MFLLVLLLFVLAGGIFAVISIENLTTSVHLTLLGWQTPDLPVGLLVLFTFLFGALLLYLVSVLSALRDKRALKELYKRVDELERQQIAPQGLATMPPIPSRSNSAGLQMPGMFTPPK